MSHIKKFVEDSQFSEGMNDNRCRIGKAVSLSGNTPRKGGARSKEMDLQQVLDKRNMHSALKAVLRNNGSAGVDYMPATKLLFYLNANTGQIDHPIPI